VVCGHINPYMSNRLKRELYLLPRGEQRAFILLSLLLILSLIFRFSVELLPQKQPEGLQEFKQEASLLMAAIAEADSLRQERSDSIRLSRAGSSSQAFAKSYPQRKKNPVYPIDINRADSTDLLPLPGIGPVYAGRIIRYRELLGGYASPEQLKEVYGISSETFEMIAGRVSTDTTLIIKLDINKASFKELLRHPYLEFEDVKSLVNFRDFKAYIQSVRELQENFILPDSVLIRMMPYLHIAQK